MPAFWPRSSEYAGPLNRNAELIALVDVLAAGGELAQRRNYVRPELAQTASPIQDGRHPVLEAGACSASSPTICS